MSKRSVTTPAPRAGADLVFFGGKGGVGKTTCAAAFGIARAASGARVLLVSTDPAHSLADVLGVRLSSRATSVAIPHLRRRPATAAPASLHAIELDARRSFRRWLATRRAGLVEAVEHGSWLDRSDAESLLDLSFPGVDELAGMLEIVALVNGAYDTVVVDTAPTGHTLRMFDAPATVEAVAAALDAMQLRHRTVRDQFGGRRRPERSDRVIEQLALEAATASRLLRRRETTSFHWVMLPEALSLAETEDGVVALERSGLSVGTIVINRVLTPGPPCAVCDARRIAERRVVRAGAQRWRGRRVMVVADRGQEPRGARQLARVQPVPYAEWLRSATVPSARRRRPAAIVRPSGPDAAPTEWFDAAIDHARIIFVAGKGGVGKTTVAAACALRLARRDRRGRVLLLSTDPAHSLGDVFGSSGGDAPSVPRGAPTNLRIRELDAAAAMAQRRNALGAALDDMTGGLANDQGRESIERLIALAPPGVDEVFGLISVAELLKSDYDRVVVDMAPTGHALRLLELPETASAWVHALMRMVLKYRQVRAPGRLGAELVDVARQLREVQGLLRDAETTRCFVVSRAGAVPLAETERLLTRLHRLHVHVPVVVANATTPRTGSCPHCSSARPGERRHLEALRAACERRREPNPCAIIQAPLTAPPPRGTAMIERWSRAWMR